MNVSTIPVEWLPQYSYADYENWEGDWELIYGLPYAMSPSAKRTHQATGKKLIQLIEKGLANNKSNCDCETYYELDWIVNENTVIRPDIMVVCGKFEEDFLGFPPTLIVEIASAKTRLKDRNVKFKLYESNGVKFYLIADPEKKIVEVFMLKDNQYRETTTNSFQLTPTCNIELNLNQMW